ncbi:HTH domain-containing protein [Sphingomonas sp. PP-CC-3G-468]|nr:HTH domain-containing protein [Sphingomonas sp. PP-CC-3G-468]
MTAGAIADTLEVGTRTIYRDVAALVAQHVPILGEVGIGYLLEPGFDLPPLMFTTDEVEAVTLGVQWVIANADADMARAALAVLAKVSAVVPNEMRSLIDDPSIGTPPTRDVDRLGIDYSRLRQWCRQGRKLAVFYRDETGAETRRLIWPFMLGYVAKLRVVIAWCEMRTDFRIFRTDRIVDIEFLELRYPESASVLRTRWLSSREDERQGS